jgi:hypothetical protein
MLIDVQDKFKYFSTYEWFTVVSFYNKSRAFTYQEFQNGTLQAWLEETWLWWQALSPCSTSNN